MTVGAGAVWAFNERGRLVRIDPATNRVTHRVALRLPNGDLLTSRELQILDGSPWALGLEGALRLNPRDGHVEHFTPLPDAQGEPRFAVGSGDSLWVLDRQEKLNRYSLATGRRTGALPVRMPEVIGAYAGEELRADLVISNADMHHTETQLLPEVARSHSKRSWKRKVLAPSAFILYLGVRGRLPDLTHHNLAFGQDWRRNFADLFDRPAWPDDPSYYV